MHCWLDDTGEFNQDTENSQACIEIPSFAPSLPSKGTAESISEGASETNLTAPGTHLGAVCSSGWSKINCMLQFHTYL